LKDLAKEFDSHFWSARGYLAVPTKKKSSNGKVRFDYRAISEEISKKHWEDHFKTDHGLTPSPIVKGNMCWWGAIDIDVYNLDEKRKYDICNKCKQLHLIPTKSKSGGLQLYAFASVEVPTRLMKGRLIHARNVLELDPKTEIFPKQLEVNGKNYGNGITVPYRSYLKNPDSVATYGLNAHMGKLYQLGPEPFLGFIEKNCKDLEYHQQFKILDKAGSEKKIFGPGDIKYSKKEIIRKIKEQSEHPRGGTFDNWILDYVAKSVVGLMTDDFIHLVLEPLWEFADRDEEDRYQGQEREEYFDNKIANVRKHFGIEDPKISREKFFKNIVYIKQKDKFFDLSTNEEYSDKAINFTYAKFFDKTPSLYLKRYASRLVVEDWIYNPKEFDPENRILTYNNKLYLNSYSPNDLEPEQGDTSLLHELLDHYFQGQDQYKDHFLNWWAYQLQYPGEKIRHAIILHSTHFQTGKGSIWLAMKKTFGIQNAKEIDVQQAVDKGKSYLTNSQVVMIDEIQSAGKQDKKIELLNNLKRIITEENISSRQLYIDYKVVYSCTNYILLTNHKNALSLPPGEVRYWVYMCEKKRKDTDFYKRYHKWLDNGGPKAILFELLERIIPESFEPKGVAPETPFTKVMSEKGAHPLSKQVKTMYDEEIEPFTLDRDIIGSTELFNWLQNHRVLGRSRINDVVNALEFIGAIPLGQIRVTINEINNTITESKTMRPSLYIVRNHEKYEGMDKQKVGESWRPILPGELDPRGKK
jgi:hypothetical protein|tara:strand:+ start:5049 stop:7307 length:2259 start_codon:yes stop_codon:yes gene_type:complete